MVRGIEKRQIVEDEADSDNLTASLGKAALLRVTALNDGRS
jgi:hypothetical protein